MIAARFVTTLYFGRKTDGGSLEPPSAWLDRNDIFGLRALCALGNYELDLLTLSKGFESGSGNCAKVCKDIGP